jgi:hypothetical protein
LTGTWLVPLPADLAEDEAVASTQTALTEAGARVLAVPVAESELDRSALTTALRAALGRAGDASGDGHRPIAPAEVTGVLALLSLDDRSAPDHPSTNLAVVGTAAVLQALGDLGIDAPLWCVTRGAVTINPGDPAPSPASAAVWGLGRAAALEYPDRWGGLVDLPPLLDAAGRARLSGVLTGLVDADGGPTEDQVAVRDSGIHVRRLARSSPRAAAAQEDPDATGTGWRMSGTVLITGGTGGLGGHVARWAAHRGAARIVLASRRGEDAPGAVQLRTELTAPGV